MEVRIESLIEGARRTRGVVVIVDVFRAFTTAAVAFARGVGEVCGGEANDAEKDEVAGPFWIGY